MEENKVESGRFVKGEIKVKKVFWSLLVLMFIGFTGTAMAVPPTGNCNGKGSCSSTDASITNTNTAVSNSDSRSTSTSFSGADSRSTSSAIQGQTAFGGNSVAGSDASNAGNNVSSDVNVSSNENHKRGEMLAYSAPSYAAQKGVSTSQMGSILGSLTISDSEQQEIEATRTDILLKLLDAKVVEEAAVKTQVTQILDNLEFASRPKRWLGFGWKTQGKSLENVFGVLSWTSFRGNGPKEEKQ